MTEAIGHADEIVRLLALQVRQTFATQNEAIPAFEKAGFEPKRTADLQKAMNPSGKG